MRSATALVLLSVMAMFQAGLECGAIAAGVVDIQQGFNISSLQAGGLFACYDIAALIASPLASHFGVPTPPGLHHALLAYFGCPATDQ
eukprot:gene8046-7426_t